MILDGKLLLSCVLFFFQLYFLFFYHVLGHHVFSRVHDVSVYPPICPNNGHLIFFKSIIAIMNLILSSDYFETTLVVSGC